MAINIIVFEDNEKLRISLKALFEYNNEFELVGAYENALEAKKIITQEQPDVVLLDIDMPKLDGISAIPVIKEANPLVSIIMYTQFGDEEKLFDSLCAGADGYILKNTSPLKLFDAIQEVREGGVPLSPEVARKMLLFFQKDKKKSKERFGLTKRESEVLQLLVKGHSIKSIASKLNIAYDTSRSHLRNIYHKLHVTCGKEAIAKVLSGKIKL